MTDIVQHAFHGHAVRVITDESGTPWFVATDLARILGYRDATNLCRRLDEDEKGTRLVSTPGGEQSVTTVTEPGLYSAILGSRVPGAREFKRWVTHELLPTIRRHGVYATPAAAEVMLADPDVMIRVLTELKAEREQRAALAARVEADAPKVIFADAVAASETTVLVGELAKIMRGNGVNIGGTRLFARLREDGFLIRRRGTDWNMPTQRAMDLGLFVIKETAITHSDGHVTVSKTPKVTGKGQAYFINRYARDAAA